MNLEGKAALVTGGAKRVGRAVCRALADAGCDIALTYRRSADEAEALVQELQDAGRSAWAFRHDLADPGAPAALAEWVEGHVGRLDVLVHNASVFDRTPWGTITAADFERQLRVNLVAPVLVTQALGGLLAADEGGRVVHFVDIHVMGRPRKGYAAYSASKSALLEMTLGLAVELAPRVTVNAIAPGVVAWAEDMTDDERQAYLARVPLERPGSPDDAARAVVYLARDADYVTGQVVRIDGGRWLK